MSWFSRFAVVAVFAAGPLQAKDDPVILTPHERLLVLPLEFLSFKSNGLTVEVAAEKSDLARQNLDRALHRALRREQSLQFAGLPDLSTDESAQVREYTDLMRTMAVSAVYGLTCKTVPWRDKKTWQVDYSIGDGLGFLAERMSVGKAIFVSGSRLETRMGLGPDTLLPICTGHLSPRIISAMVVDLRSGDVVAIYSPVRGLEGEAHDVAGANTWMHALFDDVPDHVRSKPPRDQPPPRKYERHVRSIAGYAIMPPKGWRETIDDTSCFRRHDWLLERICVDYSLIDKAIRDKGLKPVADPMALGAIAMEELKADPMYKDMEVISLTNARVGGRDGFRAELKSRLDIANSQRRERHLVYGIMGPKRAYLLRFDAPAIYYYERHVAEFETAVSTFELL